MNCSFCNPTWENERGERMKVIMIAAVDEAGFIGKDGGRPWDFPEDMAHFRRTVEGKNPVIVGRVTYEQDVKGLLSYAFTVVLSRQENFRVPRAGVVCRSLEEALRQCDAFSFPEVYLAGGEEVYRKGMQWADELIITRLPIRIKGDRRFPEIDPKVWEVVKTRSLGRCEVFYYRRWKGCKKRQGSC